MDEEYGFVVLGKAIKGDYPEDDKTFLLSLTATFLQFLGRALFIEEIRRLNDELGAGNAELQESLAGAKRLGADLDRQVFHLKSLNDTVNELSGLLDSRELMQRFLLLSMGAVSAARGFVILFSEKGGQRRLACRGMDEGALADVGGARVGRLVTRMLFASGHGSMGGLRRGVVEDAAVLAEAGLPRTCPESGSSSMTAGSDTWGLATASLRRLSIPGNGTSLRRRPGPSRFFCAMRACTRKKHA
jgi:hypothetical protein